MSATTSIIKNILRGIGTPLIDVHTLTDRIKYSLDDHIEEVSIMDSVDERVFLIESDPEYMKIVRRDEAIHKLVAAVVQQGSYETVETKRGNCIVTEYKLTLLKDRGF